MGLTLWSAGARASGSTWSSLTSARSLPATRRSHTARCSAMLFHAFSDLPPSVDVRGVPVPC
eukprot:839682-Rhodomonas_salina.4